jgi:large subunit ribosomal protein L9
MKVILQREVDKLGEPGDLVEVADGYARNYLIPRGLAAAATGGAVRHAQRLRSGHEERSRKVLAEAQALAESLTSQPLRVRAKAGGDGRLFGSITAADVARELSARAGGALDRRQVHLDEPIRSVGSHPVLIRLHPDVSPTLTVEVVAE